MRRDLSFETAEAAPDEIAVVEHDDSRVVDERDAIRRVGRGTAGPRDEPNADGRRSRDSLCREDIAGRDERLDRAEPGAEDLLSSLQVLAMDALRKPVVELAVVGTVAGKQPGAKEPILEHAVGVAMVGNLEQSAPDSLAENLRRSRKLLGKGHDPAIAFDPAGRHRDGELGAGPCKRGEDSLPLRRGQLRVRGPALDRRQVLEEK